jgi:transposase
MPAQYVKPYVMTNKNDYIDAEAIAEAVGRSRMHFVPIKTDDQLDLQSLHRVREGWVYRRTSVISQLRGLLMELGITVRKGRRYIEAALPGILEDADNQLSGALRVLLLQIHSEMRQLQSQIDEADAVIRRMAAPDEACQRLVEVPGVGPVIATAMIAAVGNGAAFRKGRGFAAWLGLVPGQYSTGGKQKLLCISKRGNPYLRRLFVH